MDSKISRLWNEADQRIEKITVRGEFILIALVSLLIIIGTICGMGTITSGFHLVDDHEFARWTYEMKCEGLSAWDIVSTWVPQDFWWRYEPMYYTMRILGTGLFGINLVAFSVVKALQIWISFICLYYCGRFIGAKKVYSFLFAAISLIGYQSAVWWKLGPQEAQCTMWFSIGFLCMLKWLRDKKTRWGIISVLAFVIMANYKESFILLIPFIVCYVVYDTIEEHGIGGDLKQKETLISYIRRTLEALRGRYWYVITMTLLFVVLVGIIIFVVGVNDYEGAGLNFSATLDIYKEAFMTSMAEDLKWYKCFGILFIAILLTYWENLKRLWKEIGLLVVFLLPQFVIFAQSGITERYILPSAIGYAFFFVLVISKWKPLCCKRRLAYVVGLVLLLLASARAMLIEADYFRYRGESVTGMLEAVREMADEDTKILSCFSPNEEGNITMLYWMGLHDIDEVYYWYDGMQKVTTHSYADMYLRKEGVDYEVRDFSEMDIVVMYNRKDRHYCYDPALDLSGFTQIDCGTITIWVRDGQGIEPVVPQIRSAIYY